jgi:hypothetical protein
MPATVDRPHHEVVGHTGITSTLSPVFVQSRCSWPESAVRVASPTSATAAVTAYERALIVAIALVAIGWWWVELATSFE